MGRVALILADIKVLGRGSAICVWFQGCGRRCHNCETPEFQPLLPSVDLSSALRKFEDSIAVSAPDSLVISGGEPLSTQNKNATLEFIKTYRKSVIRSGLRPLVFLYTGYTLEELKIMADETTDELLKVIDILIDGEYIDEKRTNSGGAGSSNQRIIAINPAYAKIAREYATRERRQQFAWSEQAKKFILVGLKGGKFND